MEKGTNFSEKKLMGELVMFDIYKIIPQLFKLLEERNIYILEYKKGNNYNHAIESGLIVGSKLSLQERVDYIKHINKLINTLLGTNYV